MVGSHPHPYAFNDPKCPLQYDDLFPSNYNTLCLQITASVTQTYTPPESFSSQPPPSYSIYNPITQSESQDSDVFPSEYFNYTDLDWD